MKYIALILLLCTISFADELRDLTNRGIAAYKKSDFITALGYFSAALERYPSSPEARFNKGLALGASGNAKEAEATLSSVKFEKPEQNAEVLYSRARIFEAVGDAALENEQQPNVGEAKKAYQTARALYARALDLQTDKKARKRTVNNIEILSQKIKILPEDQKNEENQDENKDKNNDKNNQQDQNNEQNEDENKEDEQNQDENQQNNEQNEEDKQEQNEQQQREQEEQIEDAIRLLEHYADDAKELNKPPVQKGVPAPDGKDW